MARLTEEVKRNVRSILISNPMGVRIDQFQRDYHNLLGHHIDFKCLGYNTVIEFMEALPDVAKMEWSRRDNGYRIFAVTDRDLYLPSALRKGTRPTQFRSPPPVPPGLMQQWQKELTPNLKGQYAVSLMRAPGITREDISDDFATAGEIAEVSMTQKYVFVRYNSKEEALNALEKLHTKYHLWVPPERMEPHEVVKKKDAYLKNKKATQDVDLVEVYVGGLPRNVTVEDILQRIDRNHVQSIRDMRKEDRSPNTDRYMFLIVKRDKAEEIAKQLHHQIIDGHKILAQLAYIYKEPISQEEESEASFSNKVVKGHVGALKDLDYEKSSSSESIDTCGRDVNQTSDTMSNQYPRMPPLEPAMPGLEPALPDLEPALPDLETALPDLEPALPDLEPALPDLEPALPDLEPVRHGHENTGHNWNARNSHRNHHHVPHRKGDSNALTQHLNQAGLLPTPPMQPVPLTGIGGALPQPIVGFFNPSIMHHGQQPTHHMLQMTHHPHQAHHQMQSTPYNGHHKSQSAHHNGPATHHNPSSAHHNPAAGRHNPAAGHHNPSAGHHNPSAGHHNPSAAHHNPSAGRHNPSASRHNPSTAHHNPPAGRHNPSAGHHNPSAGHHSIHTGHHNAPMMHNGGQSTHRHHNPQSSQPTNNMHMMSDEELLSSFLPGTGLLHVENFYPGTDWRELKALFGSPPPLKVQIMNPMEPGRNTHAVVFFKTRKHAMEALEYDGVELNKQRLRVYMQRSEPERVSVDPDVPTSLMVNIKNSGGDERQVLTDVVLERDMEKMRTSLAKQNISPQLTPAQSVESNEWLENKMEDSVRRAVASCCPGKAIWTPSDLSEDTIDIMITHVVNDTYMWGQVIDAETETELSWLMTMTPEILDEANHMDFTIGGDTCIAMFDDEWFRGCVMEVKRDTASVFSLDYGNTVKVPQQNLRDLPVDFWDVTAQVWPIKVACTASECKTGHELLHTKVRVQVLNKDNESPLLVVKILEL